jgi:hypothetical protein
MDGGFVCQTGLEYDHKNIVYGPNQGPYQFLNVIKKIECDGGGAFYITMKVKLNLATHHITAHWKLVDGTGNMPPKGVIDLR